MFVVPETNVPVPNANPATPYSTLDNPAPATSVQPKSAEDAVRLVAVNANGSGQAGAVQSTVNVANTSPAAPTNPPVAKEAADLISEVYGYLIAASESTMSRNNSENLALELIEKIEA